MELQQSQAQVGVQAAQTAVAHQSRQKALKIVQVWVMSMYFTLKYSLVPYCLA
jgi:hypothetical protein